MGEKEYDILKKESKSAGMTMNAWLMMQLKSNRPILLREQDTKDLIKFMDEAGHEINIVARDFNSGFGTTDQLQYAVKRLGQVYERIYTLRKKGYLHAK